MKYSKMLEYIKQELSKLSDGAVDVCLNTTMAREIELCESMYRDEAFWLSAKKGIYSAGIAGAVSAELARLVTLEFKSSVKGNDFVNEVYQSALGDLRVQTEYGCALGGLVFKPYPTDDGVTVQFVRANCFFPVSFDSSGRITKAVFVDQIRAGKAVYTRLEIHALDTGGLTVQNLAYKSSSDQTLGSKISLADVEAWSGMAESAFFRGAKKLPIGYFKVPLANTIDPDSPLGVSVFSREKERIYEADKRYSNICWELEATQAAIHIGEALLQYDGTTGKYKYPENKERLYRALNYDTGVKDKPFIEPFLPDIRMEALYKAYQAQVKMIEFNCGLAYGSISDPQVVEKTAEEIKTSKQRSYATVTDLQGALESALRDLVDAIAFWAKADGNSVSDFTLTFSWDDSIIVDSKTLKAQALLEYQQGIIDRIEYLMITRGLDEDAAVTLVNKMDKRSPASKYEDVFASSGDGED